ncbi:MAG: hypothetical protein EXS35_06840 [Pedosphaera sp.]|nr:hypothetical protein [Pedosphaera sp.]
MSERPEVPISATRANDNAISPPTDSWPGLFAPCAAGAAAVNVGLHVVRRGGLPLLYLPADNRCAVHALALYPAQSTKARLAKKFLRRALRFGLRPGLDKIAVTVGASDPFAAFLGDATGVSAGALPRFAVLAGNPHAPGRRFVFLLFDADGAPRAVVKAGQTDSARELLAHEENFLRALPTGTRGVPRLRGGFDSARARAFALDFAAGESPRDDDAKAVATLLNSWVSPDHHAVMNELPAWQRLMAAANQPLLPPAVAALATARFRPALWHGDFAPWNVKMSGAGEWTVLDWERGERAGVPGWDWFHFVLQPALLVRREPAEQLLARLEGLLASPEFLAYAAAAEISAHTRALALAYLAYCRRVTNQTDGGDGLTGLELAARRKWFGNSTH